MNLSLSKFSFVLIAFALSFVACKSDSTADAGNISLGTAQKTSNPIADASEAISEKMEDLTKKSDELLEIYVSPEEKEASDKEAALESIERKKEKVRNADAVREAAPEPIKTTKTPTKKVAVKKKPVQTPKAVETSIDEEPPLKPTKITFDNKVHEYGMIMQGDKVNHKFTFTNTGSEDLVISDVSASCGCTKPSYPFIPIAPGEKGYIGVNFDSKGKLGRQKPSVTVVSNAGTSKLRLEGFVDAERAKQPEANAPKVEIIDDEELEKLKEEALKSAPKVEEGGR